MSSESSCSFIKPEDLDPNLLIFTNHKYVNGRVHFYFTYDGSKEIHFLLGKKHDDGMNINYEKVKEKALRDNIIADLENKLLPEPMVIFHDNRMYVLDKKDHEEYEKWFSKISQENQ